MTPGEGGIHGPSTRFAHLSLITWADRHPGRSTAGRHEARRIRDVSEELTVTLGRAPDSGEVAARMGVEREAVERIEGDVARASVLSYEAVFADPDGAGSPSAEGESPSDLLVSREL